MLKRPLAGLVLAVVAVLVSPAPASAGAGDEYNPDAVVQSAVTPANNTVISSTPRSITIGFADGDAARRGAGSVTLTRAISGDQVPPAESTATDGAVVRFAPPALEAGTYIVSWTSGGGLFTTEHRSVFSVGSPDVPVTGAASVTTSPLSWPARVLGVVLALVAGFLAARRKSIIAAGAAVGAVVLCSVAVLPSGWVPTVVAAPGVVALAMSAGAALAKGSWRLVLILSGVSLVGLVGITGSGILTAGTSAFGSLTWLASILVTTGATVFATALATVGYLASRRGQDTARVAVAALVVTSLFAGLASVVADPNGGKVLGGRALQLSADVDGCLTAGNTLDQSLCLQQLYTLKVDTEGVKAALDDLNAKATANPQVRSFCHNAAHSIGRASFRTLGGIAQAFEGGYDVCDFGYYHGIIEAAGGDADDASFRKLVPTMCAELASSSNVFFEQCAHGLGHAAARRANNDMVEGLSFCAELDNATLFDSTRRAAALNACGTGVTMEWFALRGYPGAVAEDFIPMVREPRDACVEIDERWRNDCFEYVGNLVSSGDKIASLTEIATWCNGTGHAPACYKGVARAASGLRFSDEQAIAMCELANSADAVRECAAMLLYSVGATKEFNVAAVDRLCAKFPASWNIEKTCASVRAVVDDSLNGVRDGKGAVTIGGGGASPSTSPPVSTTTR